MSHDKDDQTGPDEVTQYSSLYSCPHQLLRLSNNLNQLLHHMCTSRDSVLTRIHVIVHSLICYTPSTRWVTYKKNENQQSYNQIIITNESKSVVTIPWR